MKTRIMLFMILVLVVHAAAQIATKLWVHVEWEQNSMRVVYIEDKETKTRCYAVIPNTYNVYPSAGAAISCVKP